MTEEQVKELDNFFGKGNWDETDVPSYIKLQDRKKEMQRTLFQERQAEDIEPEKEEDYIPDKEEFGEEQ